MGICGYPEATEYPLLKQDARVDGLLADPVGFFFYPHIVHKDFGHVPPVPSHQTTKDNSQKRDLEVLQLRKFEGAISTS